MKRLWIALAATCLFLAGCGSGITQEQYDSVTEQLNTANETIAELQGSMESLQKEYDDYKQEMAQYEDVIELSDEIRDYGKLKSEIAEMREKKNEIESDVEKLEIQWKELEQQIDAAKNPQPQSSVLVYSDKNIEIYFSAITSSGVVFEVKNLSDINLTFQADSVAINGISTSDILMSDDVAPQSIGKIVAKCSDFSASDTVYKVSGQLRVIDFATMKSYKAVFTNVEIG